MKRYKLFLCSVTGYYIADILWGFLYELRIAPITYAITVLYFILMVITVVLWTEFSVVYLNIKSRFNYFLRHFGMSIFAFAVVSLIVNFFNPIVFNIDFISA